MRRRRGRKGKYWGKVMKGHVWDSDISLGRNLCRGVGEWMRNVTKNQSFGL